MKIQLVIISAVQILGGCQAYTDALTKEGVSASKYYKHTVEEFALSYPKALMNLEAGLKRCARDSKQPDVVAPGTGATRYVGIRRTNYFEQPTPTRAEYELRSDGFIQVYAVLEKSGAGQVKLSYHGPWTSDPFKRWIYGETDACHGFLKQK